MRARTNTIAEHTPTTLRVWCQLAAAGQKKWMSSFLRAVTKEPNGAEATLVHSMMDNLHFKTMDDIPGRFPPVLVGACTIDDEFETVDSMRATFAKLWPYLAAGVETPCKFTTRVFKRDKTKKKRRSRFLV